MRIKSLPVLVAVLLCSLPAKAQHPAQDPAKDYPNRQVIFVVPFAPGGSTDVLGRLIGQKLSERLGKPFVIENRPGAGTLTAALQVTRSVPDGHTIMMATSSTMAINVTLYKQLPYDPGKDLVVAGVICSVPFALVVDPSLPVHSVDDLIKLARERPLSYGSGGPGSFHHLMGELFKATTGVPMTHVPYRGTVPALNDVVAGHIELMFCDVPPSAGMIQAGKVRALGVTTKARLAAFPDLAPIGETVPGFEVAGWFMVVAPARTPPAIVDKLHRQMSAILAAPEIREQIVKLSLIPLASPSVDEMKAFVKSEIARWGNVVDAAGIAGTE